MTMSLILCTIYARSQDYIIHDNSLLIPDVPTPFLQTNPYPLGTTTPCKLEVGKTFNSMAYRAVFYGGNIGVSQSTSTFGNYLGKWSFTGAWQKKTLSGLPIQYTFIPGINYLVNYHRWGDYAAHFGLRATNTTRNDSYPEGISYTEAPQKDAVITWAYETGAIPNRLIFQSIEGVDTSVPKPQDLEHEWATILSNGNIGSGTSNPTAQFQIKPINNPSVPLSLEILDISGNSKFSFSKTGDLSLSGIFKLLSLSNGINHQQLFIDENGNTYSLPIGTNNSNQVWLIGGNSFTQNSSIMGTLSNTDLQFKAGNVNSFFIDGISSNNKGFVTYTKNVVIGGGNASTGYPNGTFLTQDAEFSLSLASSIKYVSGSYTTWKKKGILKCAAYDVNNFYKEVLTLGAEELSLFDGYHKITATNSMFNGETRFEYIGPKLSSTGVVMPTNIGNSTDRFEEIWCNNPTINTSDIRLKENIKYLTHGLKTVLKLNPISYNFKNKSKEFLHYGFIAQELKNIFQNSIIQGTETDSTYLGVAYSEFIPVLTKAIQEQQVIIDSLKQKLNLMFASGQIKDIKSINSQKETLNQLPLLFQNHPNPFNGFTYIDFFLPSGATNAFIKVTDNTGKLIKAFPLNQTGFGQIELDCSNLALGQYYYSLLVNSNVIDTKIMLISAKD